jgi:hypothetical protein
MDEESVIAIPTPQSIKQYNVIFLGICFTLVGAILGYLLHWYLLPILEPQALQLGNFEQKQENFQQNVEETQIGNKIASSSYKKHDVLETTLQDEYVTPEKTVHGDMFTFIQNGVVVSMVYPKNTRIFKTNIVDLLQDPNGKTIIDDVNVVSYRIEQVYEDGVVWAELETMAKKYVFYASSGGVRYEYATSSNQFLEISKFDDMGVKSVTPKVTIGNLPIYEFTSGDGGIGRSEYVVPFYNSTQELVYIVLRHVVDYSGFANNPEDETSQRYTNAENAIQNILDEMIKTISIRKE